MGIKWGPPERRHQLAAGLPQLPCEKGTPQDCVVSCSLSRLVGSPVWDLGPELVGCWLLVHILAWSLPLVCLVDTLDINPHIYT